MILEGRLVGKEDTEKLEKDQRGNGEVVQNTLDICIKLSINQLKIDHSTRETTQ